MKTIQKLPLFVYVLSAIISFGQSNNTPLDFSSMPKNSMAIVVEENGKLQQLKINFLRILILRIIYINL